MYQKDYVLRMIEMLGELVAAILGLIKKGDFKKAEQSMDNIYYDLLKQDASFFRNIPKEKLTEKLLEEHNYTHGHIQILAELFFIEAELRSANGKPDQSIEYYDKSLLLFEFLDLESKTYSSQQLNRINTIHDRLIALGLETH